MRFFFSASLFAVLAQLAALCFAIPLELMPRSQICSNAPNTVAGTLLDRASDELVGSVWCAPRSQTWVFVNFGQKLSGTIATAILIDSYNMIGDTIQHKGDGPVIKGLFEFTRYGLVFMARNANNHQLTRTVLEGSITALWQYMRNRQYQYGSQNTITFQIFDGTNQVGAGALEAAKPAS